MIRGSEPSPSPSVSVEVASEQGNYPFIVGAGVLRTCGEIVRERTGARHVALISDAEVDALHGGTVRSALSAAGLDVVSLSFPAGEASKTRSSWARLTDAMLDARLGRDACVVGLGGGVATDLAGFVAATYMRGVPVVQLPSSYLAMIDASVGGKTGVDVEAGKNLVGAFHAPTAVVADTSFLGTLPRSERAGGLVEGVKHGAVLDEDHFAALSGRMAELLDAEPEAARDIVAASVRLKAGVVADDERESGYREVLNFGHTIGHALEAASRFRCPHGVAVALGMLAETEAGERVGVTERGTVERLRRVLDPLVEAGGGDLGGLDVDSVLAYLGVDKKARRGRARYVLIERIGRVASERGWSRELPDEVVRDVVAGVLPPSR